MVTLTMRVRNAPDVVEVYEDIDTAVRVLKACTELPDNQITGWAISEEWSAEKVLEDVFPEGEWIED